MSPGMRIVGSLLLLGVAALDILLVLGIVTLYSLNVLPGYSSATLTAYDIIVGAFGPFSSSVNLFFVVFYSWIWGTVILVVYYVLAKRKSPIIQFIKEKLSATDHRAVTAFSKYERGFIFLSGILVAALLYSYRFTIFPVPQGFDTPSYLYTIQYWRHDLLYGITNVTYTRPFTSLALYLLSFVFSDSLELLFIFLPTILAITYSLAVYFLVKHTTNDTLLAALSSNLSVASYFIIRMSYDLYSSFLYMSVMVVFLGITLKALSERKRGSFLLAVIFTFIALSVHPWTWIVTLFMLMLFSLLKFIDKGRAYFKDFLLLVVILAPSSIAVAIIVMLHPEILFLYDVKWFSLPDGWYFLAIEESSILLFFAILGLLVSLFKKDNYHRLLLSWTFAISLLILFTGYQQTYRFYILFPLGLLGAQGVYSSFKLIYGTIQKRAKYPLHKYSKVLILFALILPVSYSVLRVSYIEPYVYYPDYETMGQLHLVRDSFGFSNSSIILVVYEASAEPIEPQSTPNLRNWVQGMVGDVAYYGHLLGLLSGQPVVLGSIADFNNKSIVIASRLYKITELEKRLAEKMSEGIYLIRNTTLETTLQTIGSISSLNDSTFSNWQAVNTTISTSVTKTSNGLGIEVNGPTHNEVIDLFVSRNVSSYGLVLNKTSTVFLKTKSNMTSLESILGFVYHDPQNSSLQHVKEYELRLSKSEYFAWNVISIYDEMPVDMIYLRFSNTTNSILVTQTIAIQSLIIA